VNPVVEVDHIVGRLLSSRRGAWRDDIRRVRKGVYVDIADSSCLVTEKRTRKRSPSTSTEGDATRTVTSAHNKLTAFRLGVLLRLGGMPRFSGIPRFQ